MNSGRKVHIHVVIRAEHAVRSKSNGAGQIAPLVHDLTNAVVLIGVPTADKMARLVGHDIAHRHTDQDQ